MGSVEYFSPDFATAQVRFREAVEKSGGRLHILPIDAKGPEGKELSIDIGWFGTDTPERVLIHTSGLHGVEGFVGSAIQLQFLDELPEIAQGNAIVLGHILNPYGMAWLRRFNENNVDLNRNFLAEDEAYEGAPESYVDLDSFLNSTSPPSSDFFWLRAAWLVARHGMPKLKQSIAGGQYEYPRGLFYGGKQLEQGARLYQEWVREHLATVARVVVLDVHTGLGKSGEDTLLVEETDYERARALFGDRVAPLDADRGVAYNPRRIPRDGSPRLTRGTSGRLGPGIRHVRSDSCSPRAARREPMASSRRGRSQPSGEEGAERGLLPGRGSLEAKGS